MPHPIHGRRLRSNVGATPIRLTLIAQWNGQIDAVADLLEQFGEFRPPIDCWTHEQDIRHALGREAAMPMPILDTMVTRFATVPVGPPVTITFADDAQVEIPGEGDPIALPASRSTSSSVHDSVGVRATRSPATTGRSR